MEKLVIAQWFAQGSPYSIWISLSLLNGCRQAVNRAETSHRLQPIFKWVEPAAGLKMVGYNYSELRLFESLE